MTADPAVSGWEEAMSNFDRDDADWWLRFISTDFRPSYLSILASRLHCPPTLEAVMATLRLIVEAER